MSFKFWEKIMVNKHKESNFIIENLHNCSICKEAFALKESLNTHIMKNHELKTGHMRLSFALQVFEKNLGNKSKESNHINEKLHNCSICKESLNTHSTVVCISESKTPNLRSK